MLDKDGLAAEMNMKQSKGTNLSMLVIHLFTSVLDSAPNHILYPFTEIVTKPEEAAVSVFSIVSLSYKPGIVLLKGNASVMYNILTS